MRAAVIALSAAGAASAAILSPHPYQTAVRGVADGVVGFSPKPTTAPGHPELLRGRADQSLLGYIAPDATCGFVSGTNSISVTCPVANKCVAAIAGGATGLACCPSTGDCNVQVTCIDYAGFYTSSLCGTGCLGNTLTGLCTQTAYPFCLTFTVESIGATGYLCGNSSRSVFPLQTSSQGAANAISWKPVFQTDSAASDIPTLASSIFSFFTKPLPTTGGGGGNGNNSGGGGKSSTPVGAIVGGVVGGLAVIALIVALVVFGLLKRKKKTQTVVAPAQPQPQAGAPPMSGYPNTPQHSTDVKPMLHPHGQSPGGPSPMSPMQPGASPGPYNDPRTSWMTNNASPPPQQQYPYGYSQYGGAPQAQNIPPPHAGAYEMPPGPAPQQQPHTMPAEMPASNH